MSPKPSSNGILQLSPATGGTLRFASVHCPIAPTFATLAGWEVASCRGPAPTQTRPLPAKRTKLTSPSGVRMVHLLPLPSPSLDAGIRVAGGLTFVQLVPPFVERRTTPASPTAKPMSPPTWNSMSLNGIALGPYTRSKPLRSALRFQISPLAVVNQN